MRFSRPLQTRKVALRPRNISDLRPYLPDKLRFLQAPLLLLLVKYRAQAVRRVLRVPAQRRYILLLPVCFMS